jgi:hypothetical protein
LEVLVLKGTIYFQVNSFRQRLDCQKRAIAFVVIA